VQAVGVPVVQHRDRVAVTSTDPRSSSPAAGTSRRWYGLPRGAAVFGANIIETGTAFYDSPTLVPSEQGNPPGGNGT